MMLYLNGIDRDENFHSFFDDSFRSGNLIVGLGFSEEVAKGRIFSKSFFFKKQKNKS